jgi:hypothetical protein
MPVRFLRNASELADVSWETPLPVQVANAKPVPADTLLVATTTVDTTDQPRPAGQHQHGTADAGWVRTVPQTRLVLLPRGRGHNELHAFSHAPPTLRRAARQRLAGDCAQAFRAAWRSEQLGTHRNPRAGDGYYDQYRIEVQRTAGSNYNLISKIVGVR